MMVGIFTVSIIIVILVLVLSIVQIRKGYEYKHTVDPLPDENNKEEKSDTK